jgi:hypothetical protein
VFVVTLRWSLGKIVVAKNLTSCIHCMEFREQSVEHMFKKNRVAEYLTWPFDEVIRSSWLKVYQESDLLRSDPVTFSLIDRYRRF